MIVKLKGTGNIFFIEDEEGPALEWYLIVSGVLLEAAGEDITKKKGKYIKERPIHSLMQSEGISATIGFYSWKEHEFEFEFELPDDFDPKKIQLIKSDYESEAFPYGILGNQIMYDGEKIDAIDPSYDYIMQEFEQTNLC